MGYFTNTKPAGRGALWHYFFVSSSITIKFGVLIEFHKFSPKYPQTSENEVTAEL